MLKDYLHSIKEGEKSSEAFARQLQNLGQVASYSRSVWTNGVTPNLSIHEVKEMRDPMEIVSEEHRVKLATGEELLVLRAFYAGLDPVVRVPGYIEKWKFDVPIENHARSEIRGVDNKLERDLLRGILHYKKFKGNIVFGDKPLGEAYIPKFLVSYGSKK